VPARVNFVVCHRIECARIGLNFTFERAEFRNGLRSDGGGNKIIYPKFGFAFFGG
jgi:hypothetical protein